MVVWVGLVAHGLSSLFSAEQDEGCCHVCCSACESLKTLLDNNLLDHYAKQAIVEYGDSRWWDSKKLMVDRKWLASAWRYTTVCPHGAANE